jgi:hypothetical protein
MPLAAGEHVSGRPLSPVSRPPFLIYCARPYDFSRTRSLAKVSDSDLFDPYDRLVPIDVLGRTVEVPEQNTLLRCFQFLSLNTISYGDFCWNGDCTNCQFWYHENGQCEEEDRTALSCRFRVREGLIVTRLSRFIEIEGINK